ncbi:DHH family phosphoesterase [Candidatus Bathyarchaeota archaeon]|nr:DHH family phosphoesterase [Candidatus Bathyarchaeota archaeon]
MDIPQDFLNTLQHAIPVIKKHIEEGNPISIITHNDADGIASGSIISKTILRLGGSFKTTVEKRLDDQVLKKVLDEKPKIVVFTDFGSGYLENIGKTFNEQDVIIFDHHLITGEKPQNVTQINPLENNIDGSREIAASGVCYLFAKTVDIRNRDLANIGLIGALGDQQDKGNQKSFTGLNTFIEEEALSYGLLKKTVDLIFYGYETRPIYRALAYTTSPFIPGLSGREDNCVAFLNHISIDIKKGDKMRCLSDLTEDEKKRLFSALSNHMISQGCDSSSVHDIIGTVYTFKNEAPSTPLRDGREYSSLLNACARMNRPSIGISICLGDRNESIKEAEQVVDDYRRKIGTYLDWVREKDRIKELSSIYFLDAGFEVDENIVGVIASILQGQGILKDLKPIISAANSNDGTIKISARGADAIIQHGLHLGKIMQEAAEQHQGSGGGHDVAAGAFIPQDKINEFIKSVDEIVSRQSTI